MTVDMRCSYGNIDASPTSVSLCGGGSTDSSGEGRPPGVCVCVCAPVHVCAFPRMFMLGCAWCSFCMAGGHQDSGVWAGLRKEWYLQALALGTGTAVLASPRGQKMT